MRKKSVAGFLALTVGPLGVHRFYLGERRRGKFYFVATIVSFIASINANAPFVMIMFALSFLDAMILFSMPREEFDNRYNQNATRREAEPIMTRRMQRHQRRAVRHSLPVGNPYKASGIQRFKEYDYEGAIEAFKKALGNQYDDPAVHFNLACCYSLLERTDPAFFHLTKAVHFGFVDFDKIDSHPALAYLRTLSEFDDFVKNGYQRFASQPTPQTDLLEEEEAPQREKGETLLEQIKRLGELRNKGILTEEEYVVQTKKVLGN